MVGTKDSPWTAMLLISALVLLNILVLYIFFFGVEQISVYPKLLGVLFAILIGLLNYWIFYGKNRYTSIIDFYNEKFAKKPQNIISISLVVIYIIASFSSLVILHKSYFNN
jgi:hypothetical protein